jgi:hypothetical protein
MRPGRLMFDRGTTRFTAGSHLSPHEVLWTCRPVSVANRLDLLSNCFSGSDSGVIFGGLLPGALTIPRSLWQK